MLARIEGAARLSKVGGLEGRLGGLESGSVVTNDDVMCTCRSPYVPVGAWLRGAV